MIALLYSSTALTSLTFDAEADDQTIFHPVDLPPPIPLRRSVGGETLRSRIYQHTMSYKLKFSMAISADELADMPEIQSANVVFLRNFWMANFKYLAYKNEGTYTDYIEVAWQVDEFPVTYLEGLIYLPEVPLELITVASVSPEIMSAIGLKPVDSEYY